MKSIARNLSCIAILLAAGCGHGVAATINAASLSDVDVQTALDGSSSGDTILMPAGAATWTNDVTIPAGRILKGAGIDVTFITGDGGPTSRTINFNSNCELTAFTILSRDSAIVGAGSGAPEYLILGPSQPQDFRIHHIKVGNIIRRGIGFSGNVAHAKGVIDHCNLRARSYSDPTDGAFQLVTVDGPDNNVPPAESTATGSLYDDPGFGTDNSVFVEDCILWQDASGDSSIETYTGGKIVVRHCTTTNFYLGVHGNDSSVRSGHSIEVYENTVAINMTSTYYGLVLSRGGTGLVWNNTITATANYGNKIYLVSYRSKGDVSDDYTLRFGYTGGQLDGHNPADGNTPVANGAGTHNGSNGSATLTDTTQTWITDAFKGNGTYATDDTLQTAFLWNRTTGAGGRITASTATTVTATLAGGTRQTWNSGDSYVITFGYPGLDQNGWGGPTRFHGTYSTQTLRPWYQWGNTWNGSPGLAFEVGNLTPDYTDINQPASDYMIQENREYYNNTAMPGYTPYTYPHPLQGISVTFSGSGSTTISTTSDGLSAFGESRLPAPTNVSATANGINLSVDVIWDEVVGADHYEYSYDATEAWTLVEPTGPTFATNELHTVGPVGTHVVKIRAIAISGVPGLAGTSNAMILVGP